MSTNLVIANGISLLNFGDNHLVDAITTIVNMFS